MKKKCRLLFYKIFDKIGYYLPRKLCQTIRFRRNHSYNINWKNPKTIDEKLTCYLLKIGRVESDYADKIKCREIIKSKGYSHLLIPSFGTWKKVSEIDINSLPDEFILKANNGCGGHIICDNNKEEINWNVELRRLKKILRKNYAKVFCEYHYKYIKRGIIAEQLLHDENGLIDYKIHCINGEPHCILVCSERNTEVRFNYFDIDWNPINYGLKEYESSKEIKRPSGLDEMLECCRTIVSDFPFARVDFYCVNDKTYIGEVTLTPAGCSLFSLNDDAQRIMGDLMKI